MPVKQGTLQSVYTTEHSFLKEYISLAKTSLSSSERPVCISRHPRLVFTICLLTCALSLAMQHSLFMVIAYGSTVIVELVPSRYSLLTSLTGL